MIKLAIVSLLAVVEAANENAAVPTEEDIDRITKNVRNSLSPQSLAILESYEAKVADGTEPVLGTFRERD